MKFKIKFVKWMVTCGSTLMVVALSYYLISWSWSPPTVTDSGAVSSMMDVSPDGKEIVFSGAGRGIKDLFMLDLATSKVTRLTNTSAYEDCPSFSPDGKEIVFARAANLDAPRYLYIMELATGATRQITSRTSTSDTNPRFSADGSVIVFQRDLTHEDGGADYPWSDGDVYTVRTGSGYLHIVSDLHCHEYLVPTMHDVKTGVLFSHSTDVGYDTRSAVYLTTGWQNGIVPLQSSAEQNSDPVLFRDGHTFAFVSGSGSGGVFNICTAKVAQHAHVKCLFTFSKANWARNPSVTADGAHIYFIGGNPPAIWVVDTNGKNLRQVDGTAIFDDPMSWKPGT